MKYKFKFQTIYYLKLYYLNHVNFFHLTVDAYNTIQREISLVKSSRYCVKRKTW